MVNTQKKFQSIISQTRLKSPKDTPNGLNLFENIDQDGFLQRRQYYAAAISKIRTCFEQNRIIAASLRIKARLNRDAIPTLDNASEVMQIEKPLSNRKRRKVRI